MPLITKTTAPRRRPGTRLQFSHDRALGCRPASACLRPLPGNCWPQGRLATAESCTGGWIAKACTDLPGSSRWFQGGVVAYADAAKAALLGVPGAVLADTARSASRWSGRWRRARWSVRGGRQRRRERGRGAGGGTPKSPWAPSGSPGRGAGRRQANRDARANLPGDRDSVRRWTVQRALDRPARAMTDRLFFALWPDEPLRRPARGDCRPWLEGGAGRNGPTSGT